MPPEVDQDIAEIAESEGDTPAVRALRAEREARKTAERAVKVLGVLGKHPTSGLSPEDVEGMPLDKIEALAARLGATPAPAAPPAAPVEPKPETVPSPTDAAFARASQIGEGVPPVTEGKKLGRDEAWTLMQRNPAEYERLRQAGRIDLGVTSEERGGSTIFHPSN